MSGMTLAQRIQDLAARRCRWSPEEERTLQEAIELAKKYADTDRNGKP